MTTAFIQESTEHLARPDSDGYPVRTLADIDREQAEKLAVVAQKLKRKPLAPEDCRPKRPSPNRRRVRCVETGNIYDSQRHAAASLKVPEHRISRAVITGREEGGYHWQRVAKAGPQ